jgi:hypothetical protein
LIRDQGVPVSHIRIALKVSSGQCVYQCVIRFMKVLDTRRFPPLPWCWEYISDGAWLLIDCASAWAPTRTTKSWRTTTRDEEWKESVLDDRASLLPPAIGGTIPAPQRDELAGLAGVHAAHSRRREGGATRSQKCLKRSARRLAFGAVSFQGVSKVSQAI